MHTQKKRLRALFFDVNKQSPPELLDSLLRNVQHPIRKQHPSVVDGVALLHEV
jgi:hypothetical protein